ncbi:phytanoyl-CoA dioxygenase family protein [Candidatus Poribacteria bacterium]|nr:phytanoyl-CoA dioxygenase family protein [Candidatus Poribacteria bacterium]
MKISQAEREQHKLTEENLAIATRTLRECGYVMLEGVMPKDWVVELRDAFTVELIRETKDKADQVEKAKGHYGVSAPMRMPFIHPLAIENPFALQIMEAAMGENIFSYLPYGCNTSWPGSGVQRLHRDTGQLFPGTPFVLPISIAVVNIPLVDFTVENGATEVWPGSHLIVDLHSDDKAKQEERAAHMPSVQMVMPAGSVVVRDLRCWHRGMPNRTQTIRPMTAMVYFRQFHHLPDGAQVFRNTIPQEAWEGMSKKARHLYRYNGV